MSKRRANSASRKPMVSVLVTAFEPFGPWRSNASRLCLERLVASPGQRARITTNVYPVDFPAVRERLAADLQANHDYALHLGQVEDCDSLKLEQFALNVGCPPEADASESFQLEAEGPAAYRCQLPLARWAAKLRAAAIPARVSFHAGTYLCNATLYWSRFWTETLGLTTRCALLHLPLDESQMANGVVTGSCMPSATAARGVQLILDEFSSSP